MVFSSFEFIFIFLPVTFFIYFQINKKKYLSLATSFLAFASLFFYSWWNIIYLPLIISSILVNYGIGYIILKNILPRKIFVILGVLFNLCLLFYFKYSNFFIDNLNTIFDLEYHSLGLALPLAISFFTFQQIAYLIDCYKDHVEKHNFINYIVFVTFFPQLIAGPIVHHKEMMPQFSEARNKNIDYQNICLGIFIFSIGLF